MPRIDRETFEMTGLSRSHEVDRLVNQYTKMSVDFEKNGVNTGSLKELRYYSEENSQRATASMHALHGKVFIPYQFCRECYKMTNEGYAVPKLYTELPRALAERAVRLCVLPVADIPEVAEAASHVMQSISALLPPGRLPDVNSD